MRIAMIGHKHYGSREGGIEVVVTELARRMVALGHEVTCYDRMGKDVMTGKMAESQMRFIDGVRIVPVATFDVKGIAALSSSYSATRRAIKDRPDVIHYHAEGSCNALPLASRAGIRTVATVHSLDWQRAKWGNVASCIIRRGERLAAKHADELIVLSHSVNAYFDEAFHREVHVIPNGVNAAELLRANLIEGQWGLTGGSYILYLGRIVPEKRVDLLLNAFKDLSTDKRLVIVGGASDTPGYLSMIERLATRDPRVVMTGFVTGRMLAELYSNAYCYVLPSDVEGMPVSLLEAMAYGRACVTSDIPECVEVLSGTGVMFSAGDVDALRNALSDLLRDPGCARKLGDAACKRVAESHNWDSIVERTLEVYRGDL